MQRLIHVSCFLLKLQCHSGTLHNTTRVLFQREIFPLDFQDGSLPFARSIRDIHSEFRLLSKLTELFMSQGEQQEALQYATLAVQIAGTTGISA